MKYKNISKICSNCTKESNKLYDVFGDGLILYCGYCFSKMIGKNKTYKYHYPNQYKKYLDDLCK